MSSPAQLYLELLKKCLTRSAFDPLTADQMAKRQVGMDWPETAETMVGHLRLDNVQMCVETALRDGIPGDLCETGVWRGGTTILMRAVLAALGDTSRSVWVCDSFEGLPKPNADAYPVDRGDTFHTHAFLAVSVDEVRANFARYTLLDERVHFFKGWFKDTLPGSIEQLAVLRLDGDMYESTIQVLDALYDKVSPGGFVIVDDYSSLPNCRAAVTDFRSRRGIFDEIKTIDWTGVWWRKGA